MLNPGQELAHFTIREKLGEGGMGEVYLAEDRKLGRQVALKIMPAELFDDEQRRRRFRREAQTAARISHPNVMSIYDISAADNTVTGQQLDFIVMECVRGRPLLDYLQSGGNDMASVVRLAEKIAAGLAAAHRLNIIHRDIKAANVMVDDDGEPKILDFGLAKPLDPVQWGEGEADSTDTISQRLTKAGKIVGTVSYMSPEQARGEPLDARSDVFSFGVLLYRMATRQPPFEGSTPVSTLAKILESRPEPPRAINNAIPPELERVIEKCLQKDPRDRYQDTRDLVVDLRNLRRQYDSGSTDQITAEVVSVPTDLRARHRRITRLVPAFAVVVIAALVVLAINMLNGRAPGGDTLVQAGENSLAIMSFENTSRDDELRWLESGLPEILLTDLSEPDVINVIGRDRLHDYLRRKGKNDEQSYTHADLLEAARGLGAATVLSGSFYRFDNRIRIDARLEEVGSGDIVMATKVVGDDAFELVDSLTARIAEGLGVMELAGGVSVASVTTSSPEAYRLYLQGMDRFNLELYDEAIELFEHALEIDPNFTLAYMRIGMVSVFRGKPQQGASYFAQAREHRQQLPLRERNLLDVYCALWLDHEIDEGMVRLESYVGNFPDDKEGHAVYGLAISQLYHDTATAFAHLDTALAIDPQYQLALSFYVDIYENLGLLDRAIGYAWMMRKHRQESPASYLTLAGLYRRQGKIDESIREYEEALARFPDHAGALVSLCGMYERKRDFQKARQYLQMIPESHADDPFRMESYYSCMADLANWQGRFRTSLEYLQKAVDQARLGGDSVRIVNALDALSVYYWRFGMPEKSLEYSREATKWIYHPFQKLDYPIRMVSVDHSLAEQARPIFHQAINDFKARTPSVLWPIAEQLERYFEGHCRADTELIISALDSLAEQQQQEGSGNVREAGELRILTGQYESGIELLQRFVAGRYESTSGYHYPHLKYLLGIAHEGQGRIEEAVAAYREMLSYWGEPEIELKEITDARARLARLTS